MAWRSAKGVPGFLTAWWLLFVIVGFLSFRFEFSSMNVYTYALASETKSHIQISIGFTVAWMLVTLMAIFVVRRLAARQAESYEAWEQG